MKELILGQIPDNFDPLQHIAISPICFMGMENVYPDFENLDYTEIYNDKNDQVSFDKLTSQEALAFISDMISKFYGQKVNDSNFKFWRTIFFPWLGVIIPFLYRKHLLVKKLVEKYESENLFIRIKTFEPEFKFINVDDFLNHGIRNILFNEWITQIFLMKVLPKKWVVEKNNDITKFNLRNNSNIITNKNLKLRFFDYFDNKFFRCKDILGFKLIDRIFFHYLLSLKKSQITNEKQIIEYQKRIEWITDIKYILNLTVPEDLINIDIKKLPRNYSKGKISIFSNGIYFNKSVNTEAAFAYNQNEIVITTQHGGHTYGSAVSSEYEANLEFNSDYFFSWGWNRYNNEYRKNIVPLSSPYLSKFINKHKGKNDDIIFVGKSMDLFLYKFSSNMTEKEILNYRKNKIKLIDHFNKNFSLENFYYKPYFSRHYLLNDENYVKSNFPGINILTTNNGKSLHQILKNTKLLILDHPGTTLNVAMVMNIPFLLYWEKDWFPFNNKSSDYLDEFKKLGIYHHNSHDLINKINEIGISKEKLFSWWNSSNVQIVRNNWINNFAKVSKNWRFDWLRFFRQIFN